MVVASPEDVVSQARAAFEAGDLQRARSLLVEHVRSHPEDVDALQLYGEVRYRLEQGQQTGGGMLGDTTEEAPAANPVDSEIRRRTDRPTRSAVRGEEESPLGARAVTLLLAPASLGSLLMGFMLLMSRPDLLWLAAVSLFSGGFMFVAAHGLWNATLLGWYMSVIGSSMLIPGGATAAAFWGPGWFIVSGLGGIGVVYLAYHKRDFHG